MSSIEFVDRHDPRRLLAACSQVILLTQAETYPDEIADGDIEELLDAIAESWAYSFEGPELAEFPFTDEAAIEAFGIAKRFTDAQHLEAIVRFHSDEPELAGNVMEDKLERSGISAQQLIDVMDLLASWQRQGQVMT